MKVHQFLCFLAIFLLINAQPQPSIEELFRRIGGVPPIETPIPETGSQEQPPSNITQNVGQPPISLKLSSPNQVSSAKAGVCAAPANTKGRFLQGGCCCTYNWLWAVDYSQSMNFAALWRTWCMRWVWRTFFFNALNTIGICPQKVVTYGFNSQIDPSFWSQYEHYTMSMGIFQPPTWAPSDPATNYNFAVWKAGLLIMINWFSRPNHNCLILVSDGGPLINNSYSNFWISIRNIAAQSPWNRCFCAICFYVGNGSGFGSSFHQTCQKLGATYYQGNAWNLGMTLVSQSAYKSFHQCHC